MALGPFNKINIKNGLQNVGNIHAIKEPLLLILNLTKGLKAQITFPS
jgi:hypothetical protein